MKLKFKKPEAKKTTPKLVSIRLQGLDFHYLTKKAKEFNTTVSALLRKAIEKARKEEAKHE